MNRVVVGRAAIVGPGAAAGRLPGAAEGRRRRPQTQPFNVLIDPRIAAEGVTVADLKEQFDHNVRVRELSRRGRTSCSTRVRGGLDRRRTRDKVARRSTSSSCNTPEGVRYNKPGLQAHIQYLAGMTTGVDQKIGRDAIERYQELKKEVDALEGRGGSPRPVEHEVDRYLVLKQCPRTASDRSSSGRCPG